MTLLDAQQGDSVITAAQMCNQKQRIQQSIETIYTLENGR